MILDTVAFFHYLNNHNGLPVLGMLIKSQQLDYENAESDTKSDIDIDTEPLHIHIEDILDAGYSDSPWTWGDEARSRP